MIYNNNRLLLKTCFNSLKPNTENVNRWKRINLNLLKKYGECLTIANKLIDYKINFLKKYILNLFKVATYLKNIKHSNTDNIIYEHLHQNVLYIIENNNNIFPHGKLGGKTFKEFYKLSDYGYRQYFLQSPTPNNITIELQTYINHCYILEEAGYKFI